MKTIFISPTERETSDPEMWLAMDRSLFELVPLSETYDKFGQKIGHDNAGDHLTILTNDAAEFASHHSEDSDWAVGDIIYAFDNYDLFMSCVGNDGFELTTTNMVMAYTYWNGHNWQTIIIEDEFGQPTHEVADDVTAKKLLARRNFAKFVDRGMGITRYTHGIKEIAFEGHPEMYVVCV